MAGEPDNIVLEHLRHIRRAVDKIENEITDIKSRITSFEGESVMIIDCHGHYTTEPKDLHRFRKDQTEAVKNKTALPPRAGLKMSDDEIRESLEQNQIRLQKERGTDVTIFSPRASGMGHHGGDQDV